MRDIAIRSRAVYRAWTTIDIITTQPGIDDGPGIPPIDGGGGVVKRPGGVVHRPSGAANAPAVLGVSVAR